MSLSQSLEAIESKLRKSSEILGNCNLQLNEYLEKNEILSQEIWFLKNKIVKKQAKIEQEGKDKMIIHRQLNQAEKNKYKLEIKVIKGHTQTHSQQSYKPERNQNSEQTKKQLIQPNGQKNRNNHPKIQQEVQQGNQKGQYQPPSLFADVENSSDEDDDNHEQMMAKLRNKLGDDKDDDDDDDQ